MITKESVLARVEIESNGMVFITEDKIIKEDGNVIARIPHRRVLEPADDTSTETQLIKDITSKVWTQKVIDDFKELRRVNAEKMNVKNS